MNTNPDSDEWQEVSAREYDNATQHSVRALWYVYEPGNPKGTRRYFIYVTPPVVVIDELRETVRNLRAKIIALQTQARDEHAAEHVDWSYSEQKIYNDVLDLLERETGR